MAKKIILLIVVLLLSLEAVYSQKERIEYLPNFDKRKLHFGYYLGINRNSFEINYHDQSGFDDNSPVNPIPPRDMFVSVDASAAPTVGATIQMALKSGGDDASAGVVVNSDNDGPLDSQVVNSNVQSFKTKLYVTGVDKTPLSLDQSTTNNDMIQLQLTAGQGTVTISTLKIDLTGTAQDSDIQNAKLWHDVNGDGGWDAGDAQLSATKTFSGNTLTFDSCGYFRAGSPL